MIENRERENPRERTGKFTVSLARKKLQMMIIFFLFFLSFQFIFLLTGPPRLAIAILRASLL